MPKMFSMMSVTLMLAMFTMLSMVGCSSPQRGVAVSMTGTLSAYLDALPPQVVDAAGQVAKDMKLTVQESAATQLDGRFVALKADGTQIKVDINRYGDNISAVSIKVGTWGDKALSLEYFNAIKAKLVGRTRSASPPSSDNLNLLQ